MKWFSRLFGGKDLSETSYCRTCRGESSGPHQPDCDGSQRRAQVPPLPMPPHPAPREEIRFLGDMQRLETKPGDHFVLFVEGVLSQSDERYIQEVWASHGVEGVRLLALQEGMRLGVVGVPPNPFPQADQQRPVTSNQPKENSMHIEDVKALKTEAEKEIKAVVDRLIAQTGFTPLSVTVQLPAQPMGLPAAYPKDVHVSVFLPSPW